MAIEGKEQLIELMRAETVLSGFLEDLPATALYKKDEFDEDAKTPEENRHDLLMLCEFMIRQLQNYEV